MELKKIHIHRDTDFTNLLNKEHYESDEVDKKIKELESGIWEGKKDKRIKELQQVLYDKGVLHAKYQARIKELEANLNEYRNDFSDAMNEAAIMRTTIEELEEKIEVDYEVVD